jgi:anaerobic magnesium-protoporphyrin IX monomethyl ester cyclase
MRNQKIVLINPPVLAVLEPWFDEPKFVRTAIAFLAGYLREYGDFDIECIDAKFEKLCFQDVVDRAVAHRPDIIALTAFTNEIKPAAYTAGLIKKKMPNVITVIGGVHVTAIPEQTMREFPSFDIGVVGEGEETFLELCNALKQPEPDLTTIPGLVLRSANGTARQTIARPRILDQDSIPMPAWDLLPRAEEYYIHTIRGCPFNCVFCMNPNGKVARKRSVEKTVDEMEWLIKDFGAKRISFGDELFSVDMHRTAELMDVMIDKKIGERVRWDVQTHVAYINDELLTKMKAANIEKLEMGVETGDELSLKRMGKSTNLSMILNSFSLARKHKIKTGSFMLLGQPNETHDSIWRTIRFGIKINPTEPIFGTMVPYPGTEVAKLAAKGEAGFRLISTNWDEYNKQFNGSLEFTNISRRALEWYQIIGYVSVFIVNLRFVDFMKFFLTYWVGAVQLFFKALSGKKSVREMLNLPNDYEAVINSPETISIEDMIHSREYWKEVQAREVKRARKEAPELLETQMPI